MADKKISQLTGATLPLTGAEELPAVQSATTKKVTVAQMQAAPIAAQTANCVVYLNGSKVPSTAANLSYNGSTTFTLNGVSSPALYEIYSSSMSGDRARITNDPSSNVGIKLSSDYLDLELAPGVLDGSRNVKMTSANLVIGTAAKGIDFSANTNAPGMTSELLNDYEEGTWTPSVTASAGTITSVTTSGKYTKVGRNVTLTFKLVITDNGTGAGTISMTGIPFTPSAPDAEAGIGREIGVAGFSCVCSFTSSTTVNLANYLGAYPGGTGYVLVGSFTYSV